MTHINRVVVGLNEEKQFAVILRDTPNILREITQMFPRYPIERAPIIALRSGIVRYLI